MPLGMLDIIGSQRWEAYLTVPSTCTRYYKELCMMSFIIIIDGDNK